MDEQESPIDQDCKLDIGISWAVKLKTNLFPPLGSEAVATFLSSFNQGFYSVQNTGNGPKMFPLDWVHTESWSMNCMFHLQTHGWQTGHDMKYNQLELRQWKVHLPVMQKYYFSVIFQRFSCLTIFLPISRSSFFIMGLRIAPSVCATDFTLQFSWCCCNINLHGPFLLLSCCYMLSNALTIEYFPDGNSCNLTFYPVSLTQSKLWWVWFR